MGTICAQAVRRGQDLAWSPWVKHYLYNAVRCLSWAGGWGNKNSKGQPDWSLAETPLSTPVARHLCYMYQSRQGRRKHQAENRQKALTLSSLGLIQSVLSSHSHWFKSRNEPFLPVGDGFPAALFSNAGLGIKGVQVIFISKRAAIVLYFNAGH